MKKSNLLIAFCMIIILSCKKEPFQYIPVASLTLVNTVTDGKAVLLGSDARTIANSSSSQLAINAGERDLYIWPEGDSANPYYTYTKLNAADREIYSLFLGGTPSAVDGILIKENIPNRSD